MTNVVIASAARTAVGSFGGVQCFGLSIGFAFGLVSTFLEVLKASFESGKFGISSMGIGVFGLEIGSLLLKLGTQFIVAFIGVFDVGGQ